MRGRGVVSIAVLWALALSAFLLLSVSMLVRLRTREVANHEEFVRAGFAARSGVVLAAAEISQPADYHALDRDGRLFCGTSEQGEAFVGGRRAPFGPGRSVSIGEEKVAPPREGLPLWEDAAVSYEIIDEERKINVNRISEDVLGRLFSLLGVTDPLARGTAVDSILDWLDSNSLHRLNGAEDDYYGSLSPAYKARNGPLIGLEELLLIRGISSPLYYGGGKENRPGLVDVLTVDSVPGKINLNTAGAVVLEAWFGPDVAKQVLAQREESVYLVGSHGLSDTFAVTATASAGRISRTTRAVIRRRQGPLVWTTISWYDDYRMGRRRVPEG